MAVIRLYHFHAAPAQADALCRGLHAIVDAVSTADGYLGAEVAVDQADATHLLLVERWRDVASHQAAGSRIPSELRASMGPLLAKAPDGWYFDPA